MQPSGWRLKRLRLIIHNYLLDQQLKALEKSFLKNGGLRERMTRARMQVRDQQRDGRGRKKVGRVKSKWNSQNGICPSPVSIDLTSVKVYELA